MRLGLLLLIVGFVLCLSIAWAALGFFMMGIGLLCMLIAEERKKRVLKVPGPFADQSDHDLFAIPINTRAVPIFSKSPINPSFDRHEWETLVEHDLDLARLVDVLTPYGKKYVDQLAQMYLAESDKTLLPVIIGKIVETAARDARREASVEPAANELLSGDASFSAGVETALRHNDTSLRAIYEILLDSPPSRLPVSAIDASTSAVSDIARDIDPETQSSAEDTTPPVSAETELDFDTEPGLSDLLRRLESHVARRANR